MEVFELFRSLKSAAAYAVLTRADIAAYVVALQGTQAEPTKFMHLKALNAIVERLHNISHKLVLQTFNETPRATLPKMVFVIQCHSAFKRACDTGHALKGIITLSFKAFKAGPLRP